MSDASAAVPDCNMTELSPEADRADSEEQPLKDSLLRSTSRLCRNLRRPKPHGNLDRFVISIKHALLANEIKSDDGSSSDAENSFGQSDTSGEGSSLEEDRIFSPVGLVEEDAQCEQGGAAARAHLSTATPQPVATSTDPPPTPRPAAMPTNTPHGVGSSHCHVPRTLPTLLRLARSGQLYRGLMPDLVRKALHEAVAAFARRKLKPVVLFLTLRLRLFRIRPTSRQSASALLAAVLVAVHYATTLRPFSSNI